MKDARKSVEQGRQGPLKSASKGSDLLFRGAGDVTQSNRINNCSQPGQLFPAVSPQLSSAPHGLGTDADPPQYGFPGPPRPGPSCPCTLPSTLRTPAPSANLQASSNAFFTRTTDATLEECLVHIRSPLLSPHCFTHSWTLYTPHASLSFFHRCRKCYQRD